MDTQTIYGKTATAAGEVHLDFTSPETVAKLNTEADARARAEADAKACTIAS